MSFTTTLYYFSGTGNTLLAARYLAEQLGQCEIVPIAKVWQAPHIAPPTECVGFMCPTYYIGLPQIVREFIQKLDLSAVRYIFAVPTKGLWIATGPTRQIRDLLKAKGRALDLGMYVLMGQNFTPNHAVPTVEQAQALNAKARQKLNKIAALIQRRARRQEYSPGYFTTYLTYAMFMGQVNVKDAGFTADRARCTGCGQCQAVCPVNNIQLKQGGPEWQHRCQLCLACVMWCPRQAIEYQGLDKIEGGTRGKPRYHNPEISAQDIRQQKA